VSRYADIRQDFFRQAAMNGWVQPADVSGSWPVPVERWLGRFYKPVEFAMDRQRRLVNHFSIGADPEFVFESRDALGQIGRVAANDLGLKAGLAWGADNNGRLVELRPQPSRFALSTLTSMWSTLKWLSLLNPTTLQYRWRAGAYFMQDGLGGHIHFGRKRPTRPRESAALDTLAFYMFHANIWDQAEGKQRIRNAQGGGNHGYGRLGDLREQPYGYEYRTMPSWLCSPWMAYLSLVLAKLAVHDPTLLPPLHPDLERLTPQQVRGRLLAILAYYKGLDDDAALAFAIYRQQGWPEWSINDFKAAWGILGGTKVALPKIKIAVHPAAVPPLPEELVALSQAMLAGAPPEIVSLEPSWSPSELPPGYIPMMNNTITHHCPGMGEIAIQLAVRNDKDYIGIAAGGQGRHIYISRSLADQLKPEWAKRVKQEFPELVGHYLIEGNGGKDHHLFTLESAWREGEGRETAARFLSSGMFPIWRVEEVKPESYLVWRKDWLRNKEDEHQPDYKFSKPIVEALVAPQKGGEV
jgi:hypothetical protein